MEQDLAVLLLNIKDKQICHSHILIQKADTKVEIWVVPLNLEE
jgi:hypothetical protein